MKCANDIGIKIGVGTFKVECSKQNEFIMTQMMNILSR